MKIQITKKLLVLAFAFVGMVMIGNNVFSQDPTIIIADPGDGGGSGHANPCHQIWNVTYVIGWPPSATCSTGGQYICTPLCPFGK